VQQVYDRPASVLQSHRRPAMLTICYPYAWQGQKGFDLVKLEFCLTAGGAGF
jgi:hypothetical protein